MTVPFFGAVFITFVLQIKENQSVSVPYKSQVSGH